MLLGGLLSKRMAAASTGRGGLVARGVAGLMPAPRLAARALPGAGGIRQEVPLQPARVGPVAHEGGPPPGADQLGEAERIDPGLNAGCRHRATSGHRDSGRYALRGDGAGPNLRRRQPDDVQPVHRASAPTWTTVGRVRTPTARPWSAGSHSQPVPGPAASSPCSSPFSPAGQTSLVRLTTNCDGCGTLLPEDRWSRRSSAS
jgi:hypothetical protein